jgi:MFS family permease
MSPAYATDLLSRKALGRALPLVGTMNWVSGVIGFAGSGYMMDLFGAVSLYGATTFIAILAVVMVIILPANLETTQAGPVIDTKVLHREKA